MADRIKRFDPPQWLVHIVSAAMPLLIVLGYVLYRIDWKSLHIRERIHSLKILLLKALYGFAEWFLRLPWSEIGQIVEYLFLAIIVGIVLTTAFILVGGAVGMLKTWRLSIVETIRAALTITIGLGVNVIIAIELVSDNIGYGFDTELFLSTLLVEMLFVGAMVEGWSPYPKSRCCRLIAPRQVKLRQQLEKSLALFEEDHYCLPKKPFGGGSNDEYMLRIASKESLRNLWIQDNLPALREYAEYHPTFRKELEEWVQKQQVRHNPPQLAAIITACVIPMIGVVAYVIFFTDLSQQVRRLLVRFVQWFNAQPWESIGHTTLIVLLWTVGILAVIIGVASTGRVFGILNKWSLSTGELIRVTLAAIYCISADIACMICTIQFLGLKFIGWALSLPNRSGAFFGIMAIPVVGFIVAFDFLLVVFSVTGAYPLESSPDMVSRLLLPKYCKIYCQLVDSAKKLADEADSAGETYYLHGVYGVGFPDGKSRDKWVVDNWDILEEYASYHPIVESALQDWRREQDSRNVEA